MTTTHHGPQMAQDAFFVSKLATGADYAGSSPGSLRHAVEAQIERLIAFLDWIDLDPDMEPSLCGVTVAAPPMRDDGRFPLDAEQEADDEPSLGWTTDGVWTLTGVHMIDAEENHDIEQADGRPVLTTACGRVVLI
jgi:hypothetical protein